MDVKKIDPKKTYRVELSEKVEVLGQVFYPGHYLELRGDLLKTIAEKVKDAHPV